MMWARNSLPPELPLCREVNGLQCCVSLGPWQTQREQGGRGRVMPGQDSPTLSGGSPEPALAVTSLLWHREGKGTHVGSPHLQQSLLVPPQVAECLEWTDGSGGWVVMTAELIISVAPCTDGGKS